MRTCLLSLALLASGFLQAQEEPQKATIEKGRKAPDFVAMNEKGKEFKLSSHMKKGDKNVVLIFSRGAF